MAKKGSEQKRYSAEFKISVIMDMRENHLSYRETVRKYWDTQSRAEEDRYKSRVKLWERIYLKEGAAGLMEERRGRKSAGRPRKKPLERFEEKDLIAENQWLKERNEYLEAELEYLKKLDALVRERATEREKTRAVMELRQKYKLKKLLKIACLPRSTFYYHVRAGKTDKDNADKQAIMEVFLENGQRYGYRRIALALQEKGMNINHKRYSGR